MAENNSLKDIMKFRMDKIKKMKKEGIDVYPPNYKYSHQNIEKSTCYAGNGYDVNQNWKLFDWNGANNGGTYNVIFMEMSATW